MERAKFTQMKDGTKEDYLLLEKHEDEAVLNTDNVECNGKENRGHNPNVWQRGIYRDLGFYWIICLLDTEVSIVVEMEGELVAWLCKILTKIELYMGEY